MAKAKELQEMTDLEAAQAALKTAEREYEALVKTPTRAMDAPTREAHTDACRTALRVKRHCTGVVDAMLHNRPVPKMEDLAECKP